MPFPGQRAPLFQLENERGDYRSLPDYLVRGAVLLAFYPTDFGIVCTKQLCAYQESLDHFQEYGVQLVGISKNPPNLHQEFKERYQFGFDLLSDPGHQVAKAYQVTSLLMLGGTSRAVIVVGKNGMVLYRYVEPTTATHRKPQQLIDVLAKLMQSGALAP